MMFFSTMYRKVWAVLIVGLFAAAAALLDVFAAHDWTEDLGPWAAPIAVAVAFAAAWLRRERGGQ